MSCNKCLQCPQCTVVCTDETKAAVSFYLKFFRSSPIPPMMTDNQAYGTKMTYDPAYGPTTTYNQAYGTKMTYDPAYGPTTTYNQAYGTKMAYDPAYDPITTYSNEAYGHIDPEYVIVDDIKDRAPPRPSPIPAMESKDQTSSADHPAADYEIPTPQNRQ